MQKNVIVTDADGKIIGSTYLRRAKGLVKKNRAEWVDDLQSAVILTCSPDNIEEDNFMENTVNTAAEASAECIVNTTADTDILFNTREWSFNPDCAKSNKGERCYLECDGELAEAFCIGSWGWDWTSIISKPYALKKDTEYRFTFWLNGGENDRNDEVCRFQVVLDEDWDNCKIYKLNRSYIKPKKHVAGWYLYEIPFRTGSNDITRLSFTAMRAHMAVRPAKPLREYQLLKSDPVPEGKLQRHNIVFEDGWPKEQRSSSGNGGSGGNGGFGNMGNIFAGSKGEEFAENLRQSILDEIDFDDIAEEVADGLTEVLSSDLVKQIKESIRGIANI